MFHTLCFVQQLISCEIENIYDPTMDLVLGFKTIRDLVTN